MCDIETVIGKFHTETPIKGHKVFSGKTADKCSFIIARGSVPRGQWVRFDDVLPYPKNKNGCSQFEDGFHAFVRPSVSEQAAESWDGCSLPVQLKGDITIANQYGEEILVGEWVYVPTVEELEAPENKEKNVAVFA